MHQSKSIQTAILICLKKYFKKNTTLVNKILLGTSPVLSRCLKRNAFYLKMYAG